MYKIGLTGGIAAGKSTVLDWFKNRGVQVVDADLISREVVKPGTKGLENLINVFGAEILLPNGTLDRAKMGNLIFSDVKARDQINGILHSAIWEEMTCLAEKYEKDGEKAIIYDVPLLIETKWHERMDEVWLVYVNLATQIERLCERNKYTKEEALQRINSQMTMDKKRAFSDVVIDNNGSKEALVRSLEELWALKKTLWNPMGKE